MLLQSNVTINLTSVPIPLYRGKFFTLCSLENNLEIILKSSLQKQHNNVTLKGKNISNDVRKV
jgi:hypothetical protein